VSVVVSWVVTLRSLAVSSTSEERIVSVIMVEDEGINPEEEVMCSLKTFITTYKAI
jgi:hypothetical protein